ncbi:MAG: hypothetical protein PHN69_01615 [Candidatus Pacebacteria bacterium]|nr:hypothetical protein [Candidatus Paceibacterota bacterium]
MFDFIFNCKTVACSFDKTPTTGTILYQVFIFVATVVVLLITSRFKKNILKHYFVMVIGAFIFEFFTAPMWLNLHLGSWAYIYHGVSWVLTLGLASMALCAVIFVDNIFPKIKEAYKYILSILILWPVIIIVEKFVVDLGIRGYTPETIKAFDSTMIHTIGMSWLAILYLPLLFSLIIAFYKYFSFQLDNKPLVPMNKGKLFRNLIISLVGVLIFELLVGAMVDNINFPSWSYIWRDISIILSGTWVLVIAIVTWFVDKYFINKSLYEKFILYLAFATLIIAPFEAWLIHTGYRVYLPSAVGNFSGFVVPGLNIPVEVIFAVPFYLALVVSFIRYWAIIFDNKL